MPRITAVIPDDLSAVLKERARAEDRSVGAVVRRALAEHVGRAHATVLRSATASTERRRDSEEQQ